MVGIVQAQDGGTQIVEDTCSLHRKFELGGGQVIAAQLQAKLWSQAWKHQGKPLRQALAPG